MALAGSRGGRGSCALAEATTGATRQKAPLQRKDARGSARFRTPGTLGALAGSSGGTVRTFGRVSERCRRILILCPGSRALWTAGNDALRGIPVSESQHRFGQVTRQAVSGGLRVCLCDCPVHFSCASPDRPLQPLCGVFWHQTRRAANKPSPSVVGRRSSVVCAARPALRSRALSGLSGVGAPHAAHTIRLLAVTSHTVGRPTKP